MDDSDIAVPRQTKLRRRASNAARLQSAFGYAFRNRDTDEPTAIPLLVFCAVEVVVTTVTPRLPK